MEIKRDRLNVEIHAIWKEIREKEEASIVGWCGRFRIGLE